MRGSSGRPLVSVVMPIYNAAPYLSDAIESVLSQTYGNLELLAVDDCSSDSSCDIVANFEGKDSRVRLLALEKNGGVANARNQGIAEARGDYIALLDSDDLWVRSKIERQIALLRANEAQIAYCSYGLINADGDKVGEDFIVSESADFTSMLARNEIGCSTACIDASLLRERPFNGAFRHEDYLRWMELLRDGAVAAGDRNVLAFYRLHGSNRSGDKVAAARNRWLVYRKGLGMPLLSSVRAFAGYAVNGVKKYHG